MRYLILSDIHANWHALEAVLEDAEGSYDRVVCCGDLVGYCADPNRVVEWARCNVHSIVRGNHDKACAGLDDLEWFNPVARTSSEWTTHALSPANLEYLRDIPKGPLAVNGYSILHGSPADEDEYLVAAHEVAQIGQLLETNVSFFGHTHIQGGFLLIRQGILRIPKTAPQHKSQTLEFENDVRYLLNPGSVGQPRDGDPRAGYILYETSERMLTYRRVSYDVEGAQARIRSERLPDILANRLSAGT